jgi:hypothetical protein
MIDRRALPLVGGGNRRPHPASAPGESCRGTGHAFGVTILGAFQQNFGASEQDKGLGGQWVIIRGFI